MEWGARVEARGEWHNGEGEGSHCIPFLKRKRKTCSNLSGAPP